jgi:integrase
MHHNNLYHQGFKALLKRAGFSGFTLHSLRRTCATLLLSKNVNPKIVQEILGHATITQTMDISRTFCPRWAILLPRHSKKRWANLLLTYC